MYSHFVIPFVIGTMFLFGVIVYKYVTWFLEISKDDKINIAKRLISVSTIKGIFKIINDSLLHTPIFKHNALLGYMHFSLAFGWFLLIVVGSIETFCLIGGGSPLYVHIFFKYFHSSDISQAAYIFSNIMDFLLLFVLSGVALAWFKRFKKRAMGMKKRTRHTLGDRVALVALWFIFPVRLLAESITSGINNSGGFMTGNIGELMSSYIPNLAYLELPAWWLYSIVLCLFFVAMPFSRYMHIFTEIPHIMLKAWGIKPNETASKADNFQIHSCSRCGICIDPCQLQSELNINTMQAVYFLRGRRSGDASVESIDNCLMCGRCENKCPVGIDINTLRLSTRHTIHGGVISTTRYRYFGAINKKIALDDKDRVINRVASKPITIGYFAGCMTLLQPSIIKSMTTIFEKVGEKVWFADRDNGVCCGRPLRLSGDIEGSNKMIEFNRDLFMQSGITTLITACPICLKAFKENYNLGEIGIEVLHHTEYIDNLMKSGKLSTTNYGKNVTYHDPCELGRGLGIYTAPRDIIRNIATLVEPSESYEHSLCCGHSLANLTLLEPNKLKISNSVAAKYAYTGATTLITSCPQCKSAFNVNKSGLKVIDISELVAKNILNSGK